MTLTQLAAYVRWRTRTNSTNFSDTNMLISLNSAQDHVNNLMRKWLDLYHPTAFSAIGSTVPVLDVNFHELLGVIAASQYAADNQLPMAGDRKVEVQEKQRELEEFYGNRNYQVITVTIASPGVFTLPRHNLLTNDRVSFVTSGALPTGLTADTLFYYIISAGLDDDNFQVSATR